MIFNQFWGRILGKFWGSLRTLQKKTGAHRLPLLLNPPTGLHVRDNRVAKLATFQQFSAFHAFNDQVCGFEPLHVAQQ